jgi:hypothetical protein
MPCLGGVWRCVPWVCPQKYIVKYYNIKKVTVQRTFAKAIPCSEALLTSLMRRSSFVMLAEQACVGTRAARCAQPVEEDTCVSCMRRRIHACVGRRAARCAQPVPHHTSTREREREREREQARERERAPAKNVKQCPSTCSSYILKMYLKNLHFLNKKNHQHAAATIGGTHQEQEREPAKHCSGTLFSSPARAYYCYHCYHCYY